MLPSSNVVKDTAKTALKGKGVLIFGAASVITAVIMFIYITVGITYTVFGILGEAVFLSAFTLFVFMPLFWGFIRFIKNIAFGTAENIIELFYYFSDTQIYYRGFLFSFFLFVRVVLLSFIFFLPSTVATMLTSNSFYSFFGSSMPFWASGLKVVAVILRFFGAVAVFVSLLKYYLSPFMFVSNDQMEPESIIELSAVVSKSTKSDFLWLLLSLIVYLILSVLVLPLPFVLPYITMCYTVHCRYAVAKYNITVDRVKNQQNI